MNNTNDIADIFQVLLTSLQTPSVWLQFFILGIALAVAWILNNFWSKHLTVEDEQHTRLRKWTVDTGQRLVLPFTMLLLVLTAIGIVKQFNQPTGLLDIAVPLLLSLAAIRFTIYALRKAFAPTPVLKAWENTIATIIWESG